MGHPCLSKDAVFTHVNASAFASPSTYSRMSYNVEPPPSPDYCRVGNPITHGNKTACVCACVSHVLGRWHDLGVPKMWTHSPFSLYNQSAKHALSPVSWANVKHARTQLTWIHPCTGLCKRSTDGAQLNVSGKPALGIQTNGHESPKEYQMSPPKSWYSSCM